MHFGKLRDGDRRRIAEIGGDVEMVLVGARPAGKAVQAEARRLGHLLGGGQLAVGRGHRIGIPVVGVDAQQACGHGVQRRAPR